MKAKTQRAKAKAKAKPKSKAESKLKELNEDLKRKLDVANSTVKDEKTKFPKWISKNPDTSLAKEYNELMNPKLSPKVLRCR